MTTGLGVRRTWLAAVLVWRTWLATGLGVRRTWLATGLVWRTWLPTGLGVRRTWLATGQVWKKVQGLTSSGVSPLPQRKLADDLAGHSHCLGSLDALL